MIGKRSAAWRGEGAVGRVVRIAFACACAALAGGCGPRSGAAQDPWESLNRKIFWFNDKADVYVLEPAARGWDFVVPERAQTSLQNFFDNLEFPVCFANDLLQAKPRAAAVDVSRFILNTTLGAGGLFDPASYWGVEKKFEDFGQTLGRWGVADGPYLVLPLLGPSNPRDALGLAVDSPTRVYTMFVPFYASTGATAVNTLNLRARFLEEIENGKKTALDYYVFVRNAYEQRRRALISDTTDLPEEKEEDLYDFDLEDE